ncbi:MAG: hypothetical protein WC162_07265 [Sphaerochaetaceae bacterium]
MQKYFETIFDIFYLITVISIGIIMIKKSKEKQYTIFGILAVILGSGDAFHLVPRAYALNTVGLENLIGPLGIGKLVTSITMTIFYVLLYYVWVYRYKKTKNSKLTKTVFFLAMARIILCVFPQNGWTSSEPSLLWGILRNIPFLILGILIIVIYYKEIKTSKDKAFSFLPLSIIISFACYIPVVLFAHKYPLVGMLMIPKTCAYVWTVVIGYKAMGTK